MSLRLKWGGTKVSSKGQEVIEDALESLGQISIATSFMPRTTAEKIAKMNKLTLDYMTVTHKGKPTEHYVFRIDSQGILRRELTRRQRLRFWGNLAIAWVIVFLFSLAAQIAIWK